MCLIYEARQSVLINESLLRWKSRYCLQDVSVLLTWRDQFNSSTLASLLASALASQPRLLQPSYLPLRWGFRVKLHWRFAPARFWSAAARGHGSMFREEASRLFLPVVSHDCNNYVIGYHRDSCAICWCRLEWRQPKGVKLLFLLVFKLKHSGPNSQRGFDKGFPKLSGFSFKNLTEDDEEELKNAGFLSQ